MPPWPGCRLFLRKEDISTDLEGVKRFLQSPDLNEPGTWHLYYGFRSDTTPGDRPLEEGFVAAETAARSFIPALENADSLSATVTVYPLARDVATRIGYQGADGLRDRIHDLPGDRDKYEQSLPENGELYLTTEKAENSLKVKPWELDRYLQRHLAD